MSIQIIDCSQNSPEWLAARLGLVTASNFASVLAKGEGKTRRAYLYRLAGERVTGQPADTYENDHMIDGRAREIEARELYAYVHDVEPEIVGFIRNGPVGCSPDLLVGASGMGEIKRKLPHLHIECLLRSDAPPEHKPQIQGSLWVAEREWSDFISYWPGLPLCVRRQYRDEAYIKNLAAEVERFNEELALVVERVRQYGQSPREVLRDQLKASVA